MLLQLAYPGVTDAFAMLRLLTMSDRDKDVEILALRHQITVLERQLGTETGFPDTLPAARQRDEPPSITRSDSAVAAVVAAC